MMRRCALLLLLAGCRHSPAVTEPAPSPAPGVATTTPPPVVANPVPEPSPAAAVVQPPRPAKIKITVRSVPPKALVNWGKKKLGPTPVILERPRDSGPVDLVVRAVGYFPFHTRAYTFRNEPMTVRLTKLSDRMTLFGARAEPVVVPSPSPAPAL